VLAAKHQFNLSEINISEKKVAAEANLANLNLAILPSKNEKAQEPRIYAKAVYLIDVDTSRALYAKNEEEEMPVASTTKMATALVVLENYSDKLKEVVTITPKMVNVEDSRIGLRTGEKITVESLLDGLLIMSGNDTAYALAEFFGGKESFVSEMNKKVKTIGAQKTEFKDPAGLDDNGRSNAKDLALIGAYALRNQKFAQIVKTPKKEIWSVDGRFVHELTSSNRLIRQEEPLYFPFAIGVKTGFTYDAGHVLVSAAEKDKHRILAVILNTTEYSNSASAKESRKLLEWGFNNWIWEK
jgi:D-alanyl-D-alanine carboxypeptidase